MQSSYALIMKFILHSLIVMHICAVGVIPRSLQLDSDVQSRLQVKKAEGINQNFRSSSKLIWTGHKPVPRLDVQQEGKVSGIEERKFNELSVEPNFPPDAKDDTKLPEETKTAIKTKETPLKAEFELSTSIKTLEDRDNVQNKIFPNNSNLPKELIYNETHIEMHIPDFDIVSNISDNVLDILNVTSDGILLQALTDNTSATELFDFDETTLLSEGGAIAMLQEVSTIGFELLIDSETKQNLILAELLSSQTNLIDDEESIDLLKHYIDEGDANTITTLVLGNNIENETISIANEEISKNAGSTKVDINETKNEFVGNDSVQTNVTESLDTQTDVPKCPEPGWCIFWFLAQDTCAKDSHCHGSLICCLWGCSKTCIDVN